MATPLLLLTICHQRDRATERTRAFSLWLWALIICCQQHLTAEASSRRSWGFIRVGSVLLTKTILPNRRLRMAEVMLAKWKGPRKTRQAPSCLWSECTKRRPNWSTFFSVQTHTSALWSPSPRWVQSIKLSSVVAFRNRWMSPFQTDSVIHKHCSFYMLALR